GNLKAAELFDPATRSWRELPPLARPRPYHSIALLLPDARVLVGGGGLCSASDCAVNHPDVEIYSPPYLFAGPRPRVTSAPTAVLAIRLFSIGLAAGALALAVLSTHGGRFDAGAYTCPMHAELRSAAAGECPLCGMALVPSGGSRTVPDEATTTPLPIVISRAVVAPAWQVNSRTVFALLYDDEIAGLPAQQTAQFVARAGATLEV